MNATLNDDELKKKAENFHKRKILVHIQYKNKFFKRGFILAITYDHFILNERMEGELPVFFSEIRDIQPYHQREERGL